MTRLTVSDDDTFILRVTEKERVKQLALARFVEEHSIPHIITFRAIEGNPGILCAKVKALTVKRGRSTLSEMIGGTSFGKTSNDIIERRYASMVVALSVVYKFLKVIVDEKYISHTRNDGFLFILPFGERKVEGSIITTTSTNKLKLLRMSMSKEEESIRRLSKNHDFGIGKFFRALADSASKSKTQRQRHHHPITLKEDIGIDVYEGYPPVVLREVRSEKKRSGELVINMDKFNAHNLEYETSTVADIWNGSKTDTGDIAFARGTMELTKARKKMLIPLYVESLLASNDFTKLEKDLKSAKILTLVSEELKESEEITLDEDTITKYVANKEEPLPSFVLFAMYVSGLACKFTKCGNVEQKKNKPRMKAKTAAR